jgi:hypothetical protein
MKRNVWVRESWNLFEESISLKKHTFSFTAIFQAVSFMMSFTLKWFINMWDLYWEKLEFNKMINICLCLVGFICKLAENTFKAKVVVKICSIY